MHEADVAKALEVPSRPRWRLRIGLPQVARRHHAERSDCRQHADVITRQSILLVVHTNTFSGRPARQVEVAREDVTWVVRHRTGFHLGLATNPAKAGFRPLALWYAWINVSPHLNLPLLLQVRPQVIEHGIVGRKLTVNVQQLTAGVAQE